MALLLWRYIKTAHIRNNHITVALLLFSGVQLLLFKVNFLYVN